MARTFGIEVDGVNELMRELRRAGIKINKELAAANKEIGGRIATRARSRAPVGPAERGHLRDSIRPAALARGVVVRAGNARALRYGPIIHYGSSYRPRQAPRPFLSDAAQEMRGQVEREYLQAVERATRSVSAR